MYPTSSEMILRRFFAGLAEYTFQCRLGIADPPLVDYLAELLVRFVRSDALYRVRDLGGRRLEEVAEMALEAQQRQGDARREVYRHIGDFTLFWTGVYPEALKRLQGTQRVDRFLDYCQQGKRSYSIASTLSAADHQAEAQVLERLSKQFELCVYGLSEVRREWQRRDEAGESPGGLLLQ